MIMRTIKNKKTIRPTPMTLIALRAGSGHFSQTLSATLWYFPSSVTSHCVHKLPSYPDAHSTGFSFCEKYPPLHASTLSHSTILVEFISLLQNPLFTLICVVPSQTALSIQLIHSVEFQSNE